METGSYLNIVFWPRVQHCCQVTLVMNGDEQPTMRKKIHTGKLGDQIRNRAKPMSSTLPHHVILSMDLGERDPCLLWLERNLTPKLI